MFDPATKILVIDDMLTMRKLVKKALQDMGFQSIEVAEDGLIAWNKLDTTGGWGLIISDWNMPNMTGLELLKKCRTDARFMKIPFVLLTAEAEQHQVIEALKQGVSNYVVKPFTMDALKTKLEQTYRKVSAAAA